MCITAILFAPSTSAVSTNRADIAHKHSAQPLRLIDRHKSCIMNLLLLRHNEIASNGTVTLNDYRAEHILKVLKMTQGQTLTIGQMNGLIGTGVIQDVSHASVTLGRLRLDQSPPPQLPVELILALPRPRMLQRSLQTIATMGVKRLHLIHTQRVEKSFWQTPLLQPASINEQLILGLEQAKATQMPEVIEHKKWRDFAQNVLPKLSHQHKIIAHPGNYSDAYALPKTSTHNVLAVGPEGGFTSQEVEDFIRAGFDPVQLGQRILRVETAVPVLLAKLF